MTLQTTLALAFHYLKLRALCFAVWVAFNPTAARAATAPVGRCCASGNMCIAWMYENDFRGSFVGLRAEESRAKAHVFARVRRGLAGRRLTHAANKKAVSRKAALAALQAFFSTRTI